MIYCWLVYSVIRQTQDYSVLDHYVTGKITKISVFVVRVPTLYVGVFDQHTEAISDGAAGGFCSSHE